MDLKNILTIFVTVLVGLTLLMVVADKTYENTSSELTNMTNQTHSWSNTGDTEFDSTSSNSRWTITSEEYYSSWGNLQTTNGSVMTENTHYNVSFDNPADSVTLQLMTTAAAQIVSEDSNETLAEYYRYAPEYVQGSSSARTILTLNRLWFSLAIFLFIAGMIIFFIKKYDII